MSGVPTRRRLDGSWVTGGGRRSPASAMAPAVGSQKDGSDEQGRQLPPRPPPAQHLRNAPASAIRSRPSAPAPSPRLRWPIGTARRDLIGQGLHRSAFLRQQVAQPVASNAHARSGRLGSECLVRRRYRQPCNRRTGAARPPRGGRARAGQRPAWSHRRVSPKASRSNGPASQRARHGWPEERRGWPPHYHAVQPRSGAGRDRSETICGAMRARTRLGPHPQPRQPSE